MKCDKNYLTKKGCDVELLGVFFKSRILKEDLPWSRQREILEKKQSTLWNKGGLLIR